MIEAWAPLSACGFLALGAARRRKDCVRGNSGDGYDQNGWKIVPITVTYAG